MTGGYFACRCPDNLTARRDYHWTETYRITGDEVVHTAVDATLGRPGRIAAVKMTVDTRERT